MFTSLREFLDESGFLIITMAFKEGSSFMSNGELTSPSTSGLTILPFTNIRKLLITPPLPTQASHKLSMAFIMRN
jgi:hypothetical protein